VVLSGSRRDPQFLRYDAAARRVDLTIIAALDKSNSGYNLNGASYGAHNVIVPTGWTVTIDFVNRDVMPHSIAVIRESRLLPLRVARPVFAGASSRAPEIGLPAGGRQNDIAFVANAAGAYLLACGVPGHAVSGSYLKFTVSSVDTIPRYELTSRATPSPQQ
jgi:sulfocyanin